jgi:ribose transport system permease protein
MAVTHSPAERPVAAEERTRLAPSRLRAALSFRSISALYIFAALFVIFALWVPDTFLDRNTWKAMLDDQAITALVAIALVIPLSAGAFDLAIGAEVGMGSILAAWLLSKQGLPIGVSVLLTILAGGVIGLTSGLLVVGARIDSFIATLGMSSVLLALIAWVSGGQQILDLGAGYQKLGTHETLGITNPVYIMVGVSLVVWYVLERTPAGRRVYATGGNADAARLAGVRTSRVLVGALLACGLITAFAGVLVSSRLATGDPTVGPGYLLPAFAAAFLGSTQFRGGRYNVWGTVVAVYVLATGVKGLQLAGAPVCIPDLFNGVALLLAVGMARFQGAAGRASAVRRILRRGR